MYIPYIIVIVLFALGGVLIGESIISSVNLFEIVLGVICIIAAFVLLLRAPLKR